MTKNTSACPKIGTFHKSHDLATKAAVIVKLIFDWL